MADRRKSDHPDHHSWYRSERVINDSGKWYFLTREGSLEGPFECERDATEQLEVYVSLAVNGLLLDESDII
jgi:hypothetical protein